MSGQTTGGVGGTPPGDSPSTGAGPEGKTHPRARSGGVPVTAVVKRLGPVVAWFTAIACGWRLSRQTDLLDAVLRAAAVWLGVLIVWLAGMKLCERVIGWASGTEPHASQGQEGER